MSEKKELTAKNYFAVCIMHSDEDSKEAFLYKGLHDLAEAIERIEIELEFINEKLKNLER